ncbi:WD40 repeat domain-containing protein [Actinoallomurus rhizosphaericola]|uniref:WD40 repeat domain-containing protein n=1 Tax=Actinoallomurus rhizosphaericola TaxID=2952536 RepID=UPI002092AC5A|nr:WD40 repeat domain-containing protein [Actinoallomurus rhizosphaericola]MCO5999498.1 WD40 repeat domain-containing protein [Actinoallomurus rhizosphaericola]
MVSGGALDITIFDTSTWAEIATLSGHADPINELAFNSDGELLVSAACDNTARIWQPERRRQVTTLRGHDDWVRSAAFSPDGRIVATGSRDKTTRIWSTEDWRELTTLPIGEDVLSVVFHPGGSWLAVGCRDITDNIRIWDTRRWVEVAVLTHENSWGEKISFSPDGSFLASGGGQVMIWDATTWRNVARLTGESEFAESIAFSPDGRFLACAFSCESSVKVWSTRDWSEAATLTDENYISSVAFSADSRLAATGAYRIQFFGVPGV